MGNEKINNNKEEQIELLCKAICSSLMGVATSLIEDVTDKLEKENAKLEKKESCTVFNEGDWVVCETFDEVGFIIDIDNKYIRVQTEKSVVVVDNEENFNLHHWTINDAKPGDVIVVDTQPAIFKSYNDFTGVIETFCRLVLGTDGYVFEPCYRNLYTYNEVTPATREAKMLMYKMMESAKYMFDGKKLRVRKIKEKKHKPKFKVGDWITNGGYTWLVKSVDNGYYTLVSQEGDIADDDTCEYVDERFRKWAVKDAKKGDILSHNGDPFIFKRLDYYDYGIEYAEAYGGIIYNGKFVVSKNGLIWAHTGKQFPIIPATQEQCNNLIGRMQDEGYTWNAKKFRLDPIAGRPSNTLAEIDAHLKILNTIASTLESAGEKEALDWFKKQFYTK